MKSGILVLNGELFKEIKGKSGYFVSPNGEIVTVKPLTVTDNGHGYKHVSLGKKGFRERCYIHRLVAEAFIPNLSGLAQVDHKDGDRSNNILSNLQWITPVDNVRKAFNKKLCMVSPSGIRVEFSNVRAFSEEYGLDSSSVSKVLRGKLGHTKHWTMGVA